MAKNALGAALLTAPGRGVGSQPDTLDISGYRIVAVQVQGIGAATGNIVIQGSLSPIASGFWKTYATVATGTNQTDIVHLVDVPLKSMRIVYGGITGSTVDVLVLPFVEGA